MKLKKYLLLLAVAALAVVVAACGADPKANSDNETEKIEGSVVIDGSGTVYPLMARIAEEYMINEQENVSVEVSRAGTSAGFKKFLVKDGTDFNNASRQIKDEEAAEAEDLGIEVKELKVALDGLTFVINKDNDWAKEMTPEQLISIFKADSGIEKWSDLDPSWPDEKINPMGPNENHGTYEFFYESILEKQDLVDSVNLQQDYSTLVNLVAEDKNGIAFFGFGYYVNNKDKLDAVHVDFGNGAVEPSLDTISEDGDYAQFTRPVFTYLNIQNTTEKPQVLDYAIYLMDNINNFAGETGFAPIPDAEVKESIEYLTGLKNE
ncbi:PstS family phosphate ABC transporter substrate-binding protein [Sporosarcina sp. Marseille-Q4063]|uniref:PstS family phosphate ABC transporter substrate-binding protein n=1 Tax=Sporosarcina sp. Marseille-Q4063 TaxID=2810514 RepID=UPI001BB0A3A9|nr:PstS family phosphate ABC transporter substrate-binding protein [Sporosarcina sp. Marseille-Q4063]QUW20324.1 PstS family phosphate ABC transporter substrate-binding protein [Sporosarcina sp. Marseille-Q4063]